MTRKFALQRVLELQGQLEDLLQLEMAAIEGRRVELQRDIDSTCRKWEDASAWQAAQPQEPLDLGYLAGLNHRIHESGDALLRTHQELDVKRRELTAAHQEREMLQRLKDRRSAQEMKTDQRREARAMEEVATTQYLRRAGADGHERALRAAATMIGARS